MIRFLSVLIACIALAGCSPTPTFERPPNHAVTNVPPARFKFVSSEYYYPPGSANGFSFTILSDTKGTNDIAIIHSYHGITTLYLPKPVER